MTHVTPGSLLPIGEIASRTGLSVPTVRYCESRNLITSERTAGNMRVFRRYTLRRLAVIAAGQRAGLTLAEIAEALAGLPSDRAPTQDQWHQLSTHWAQMVARRIRQLEKLQGSLDDCIGCGCLSLKKCHLFNPRDEAASEGPGSRWMRKSMEYDEDTDSYG
ncbi:redox-sensitive transcriptional activator SoxR [Arthrobacter sp. MYb227]|uniref:redox-sensitive transcriptional activator SoxR n=1 Tax=Arthrobacter sp. MYb227 TaxID=1848601 RepID=UPI000CFDCF0E|nr:redox-sensitive transcriptional activator SoxR [Arthrobacter sp. MYb227]PQZ93737.1 redox-sensitive transcriptional activator SoxR [Arthrobacter sp. MYb227]